MLAAQMERADADFAVMSGGGCAIPLKVAISPIKTCSRYSRSATPVHVDMKGSEIEQYTAVVANMKPDSGAYAHFANVSGGGRQGVSEVNQRPAAAGG